MSLNQGARERGARTRRCQRRKHAISFIRTVTVGPGFAPGLLTPPNPRGAQRALAGSRAEARIPPVGSFTPP